MDVTRFLLATLLNIAFIPIYATLIIVFPVMFIWKQLLMRVIYASEKLRPLRPLDAILHRLDDNGDCYAILVNVLEGPPDFDFIFDQFKNNLMKFVNTKGELAALRFQCIVVTRGGLLFWKKDEEFRLENHIKYHPDEIVRDNERIEELLSQICSKRIPEEKPKFSYDVYPYKDGNSTLIIARILHTMSDGINGLQLYKETIGEVTGEEEFVSKLLKRVKFPSRLEIAFKFLSAFYYIPYFLTSSIFKPKQNTPFIVNSQSLKPASENRVFGISDPVSFDLIKRIKTAANASVNDVLLASFVLGVRKYLTKNNLPVPEVLRLLCPVSITIPKHAVELRNDLIPVIIDLPTSCQSSLHAIKSMGQLFKYEMQSGSLLPLYLCTFLMNNTPLFLTTWFEKHLIPETSFLLSNIPSVSIKSKLFGRVVEEAILTGTSRNNVGSFVIFLTYNDQLRFTLSLTESVKRDQKKVVECLLKQVVKELDQMAEELGVNDRTQ